MPESVSGDEYGPVRHAEYVPSRKATLDSITYLERALWPCCNETIKEHLAGIRRFVVERQSDGAE